MLLRFIAAGLALCLASAQLFAQYPSRTQDIVRKKVRLDAQQLQQVLDGNAPQWVIEAKQKEALRKSTRAANALVSGSNNPESEVHAAINPTNPNNIVASANATSASSLTNGLNPIYYSNDFGNTWQLSPFQAKPAPGTLVLGGGDPMFAFDKNGKVYMSWINLHASLSVVNWDLFWAWSSDGGATWTKGTQPIAHGEGTMQNFMPDMVYDKQWMSVDHSTSPHQNTVYCVFFEANADGTVFNIAVRKKTPAMNNFTSTSVIASQAGFSNLQFSSIDVDNNGGVHVTYFATLDNVNWALYHTRSTDGAATFGPSVKISDVHLQGFSYTAANDSIVGIQRSRMYPCPHVKVDKSNGPFSGRLYAVWTGEGISGSTGQGTDIYLSLSSDNGQTWSTAQRVNNDNTANDNFYPSIDVSPTGVVVLTWYDRRGDPANLNTHYFMAYSFDGGVSFPNQFAVSDLPTDFSTVGSMTQGFGVGEYNQVVTTTTMAMPVWADARGNDGQLDIYAATAPLDPNYTGVQTLSTITGAFNIATLQPNPATDKLLLDVTTRGPLELQVIVEDVSGKVWLNQSSNLTGNKQIVLDVSSLPAGAYTLRASDGKTGDVRKFVKM